MDYFEFSKSNQKPLSFVLKRELEALVLPRGAKELTEQ